MVLLSVLLCPAAGRRGRGRALPHMNGDHALRAQRIFIVEDGQPEKVRARLERAEGKLP